MSNATQRVICRWIHIVLGIPIIGYVYSPFAELPNYAPVVRYVAMPMILVTGLWMWQGPRVRRMMGKVAAAQGACPDSETCDIAQESATCSGMKQNRA